jgi:DnaJ-class molecular chaperone
MKLLAIRGYTHDHVPKGRCRICAGWGHLQPHRITADGQRPIDACPECNGTGLATRYINDDAPRFKPVKRRR